MGSQILAWIIVGLLAGFLAKLVMPDTEDEPSGFFGTIVLGIVGAVVGGWIWLLLLNEPGLRGIDFGSLLVAFMGSVIVIALLNMFARPTPSSYS